MCLIQWVFLGTRLLTGGLSMWFIAKLYFPNKHGDSALTLPAELVIHKNSFKPGNGILLNFDHK